MNTSKLIITADDYGLTEGVSTGIREAISCGNVSCTSVLMNYISDGDLKLLTALKESIKFGIGLHINLTEGIALTTGSEFTRDLLNDSKFITNEINAQAEIFKQFFGEIDHINFHQHIHYDLRVLQEFLKIDEFKEVPVRFVNRLMKEIFYINQRTSPDRFVNVFPFFSLPMEFENHLNTELTTLINNNYGIVEWMVHPGYTSIELEKIAPNYSVRREQELKLLCNKALSEFLFTNNIVTSSFKNAFA